MYPGELLGLSSRRSPHGERGLKCILQAHGRPRDGSLPARGAWIEMLLICAVVKYISVAPRTGSVD